LFSAAVDPLHPSSAISVGLRVGEVALMTVEVLTLDLEEATEADRMEEEDSGHLGETFKAQGEVLEVGLEVLLGILEVLVEVFLVEEALVSEEGEVSEDSMDSAVDTEYFYHLDFYLIEYLIYINLVFH
jgi:hypothetical protein